MGLRIFAVLLWAAIVLTGPAQAQAPNPPGAASAPQAELVIGTKEAPPFSMKAADGTWIGISIDLWRHVADSLNLRYRFVEEPSVQELIDGVAGRKYDVAVAAVTVTASRARDVDFTQPFYITGLGIAVPAGAGASWLPVIRTILSFGFAQAVAALIGAALVTGILVWIFERRHNADFGGGAAKGLSAGVWWSTVAMTQRTTGSVGPQTMPGRIVAIVWMIASIITIAVFTASVTSALTIKHLQGIVHGVSDLSSVRVGTVTGTSTNDVLTRLRIPYRPFANPQDGLNALRANRLDAFVYDKPLLAWLIHQDFGSSLELIDTTFGAQEYAFAVPGDSPLEKTINVALLDAIHSDWWEQTTIRYLGAP
jgi:polar amino acid transport system substrate-binding protein